MPKNWWFWTTVLQNTLESPLDCKEVQPVHPKGNQSWLFIGRIDVEAEAPILWPHDLKNWLIGKDPDAGKDWRQEEKGTTEDEMVGWHHRLDGREFEQAPGVGDGQESLACCRSWGHRITYDWATKLNWTEPLHTHCFSGKESTCQAEDAGLIPWSGRSPGERNGNPLQCSCLRNPMDRRAWQVTVHGVAKESNMTYWLHSTTYLLEQLNWKYWQDIGRI